MSSPFKGLIENEDGTLSQTVCKCSYLLGRGQKGSFKPTTIVFGFGRNTPRKSLIHETEFLKPMKGPQKLPVFS